MGPAALPTTSKRTQGIAPAFTNAGSSEVALALAHTLLVSPESSHVARTMPFCRRVGIQVGTVEVRDELLGLFAEQGRL